MLTNDQIKWASGHDWFITQHYIQPGVIVVKDDDTKEGYRKFDNYGKLRTWAGY